MGHRTKDMNLGQRSYGPFVGLERLLHLRPPFKPMVGGGSRGGIVLIYKYI